MDRIQLLEGVIRTWKRNLILLKNRNGKEDKREILEIEQDIKMVEEWIKEIKESELDY